MASGTKPTLQDVAREAGVSQMTASRVVRGSSEVSQATRALVENAVQKLGYMPSKLKGTLSPNKANQVAVIIPSLVNNVFPEVLAGIAEEFDKVNYNVVIGLSDYNLIKEEHLISSMLSWQPTAMITTSLSHSSRTTHLLTHCKIPVVQMMDISDPGIDICVGLDQREAARTLALFLLEQGYKKFAYIGWNYNDFAAAKRFNALSETLADNGIELYAPGIFNRPPSFDDGKCAAESVLADQPDTDVIVFSNDTAAHGGQVYCLENNIDVPGRVAIAGFSGLQSPQAMHQKLTTIFTPRREIGRQAALSVLNRLAGHAEPLVYDIGFELLRGDTA